MPLRPPTIRLKRSVQLGRKACATHNCKAQSTNVASRQEYVPQQGLQQAFVLTHACQYDQVSACMTATQRSNDPSR